jgi:hypothetical protein
MTGVMEANVGELIQRKRAFDSSRYVLEKAQKDYENCLRFYKHAQADVRRKYEVWDPPLMIRDSDPEQAVGLMCLRRILRRKVSYLRYRNLVNAVSGLPNELFEDILVWLDNGVMCCHLMCEIGYDSRYDWQRVICYLAGKRYFEPEKCICYRRTKRRI